ncbi:hypothetical protein TSUD_126540 [Trifolium subterraneum]|uniref:Smr domain-containing protein n=1 Tax=Trifolium subterraneum TaxID=3900 RepID=A0A2Z6M8B5_TRISU|nr:hypothetical protein TSUD_126540 [Trifolium subterraneum]
MEEAVIAYDFAKGDPNKASEILRRGLVEHVDDPFSSSSSSSYCESSSCSNGGGGGSSSGLDFSSTSGSSDGFVDQICGDDVVGFKGVKQQKKKIVAATGTVSTILGNEYVRRNSGRKKRFGNEIVDKEEAEQFLYSMLGNDCDLNLAVVRDVLCQCGYDVEKIRADNASKRSMNSNLSEASKGASAAAGLASDVLLDLAATERSSNDRNSDFRVDNMDGTGFLVDYDRNDGLIDRRSECTSFSSEGDFSDGIWGMGSYGRNSAACLQYDNFEILLLASSKGEEYHTFREGARQEWDSVKCYFQKAATAYTKGDRGHAAYLSDQGKEQTKIAQKADTKASHDIFVARNKDIENVITIDLHGQHVKPAMRMLKLHLLFGSYVPSVQMIRVITGCGSHGFGKSKLKQSVTKLLDEESIEWREENRGTVLIKLNGFREFSFLDTDSDTDGD